MNVVTALVDDCVVAVDNFFILLLLDVSYLLFMLLLLLMLHLLMLLLSYIFTTKALSGCSGIFVLLWELSILS